MPVDRVETPDAVVCESGGPHEWRYQGRSTQRYLCGKCGKVIQKRRLKEETDA